MPGDRYIAGIQQQQLTFGFDRQTLAEAERARYPATPIAEVIGETRHKVRRIRPPVKAHGGKYYLARQIVPVLLSAPGHPTEYLEPCVYGGSVLLALPRFQREIVGDINPDVVQLWRTLAHQELSTLLSQRLNRVSYSEQSFIEVCDATPTSLVDQAVRFVVKSRFSRGGLGRDFAWSQRQRGGLPGDENAWNTFREIALPRIIQRAQGVEVLHDACWWTVWESRREASRLIYADPPYMPQTRTAKTASGPFEMTRLQHYWLVAALRAHSGPAAVSGYRCTDYDRWLRDWRRLDFEMPNHSGQG